MVRETFTPDGGTKIVSRTEEIRMNEVRAVWEVWESKCMGS